MSSIQYFEKWFLRDGIFSEPLTREQAASRHAAGEPYIALRTLDDGDRQVVDIAGVWISVYFLDEYDRPYLHYDFKRVRPGIVFLDTVRYEEYADDTDNLSCVGTLRYKEDGSVLIVRWYADETEEEKEERVDPRMNWDRYPEFGEYEHICRFDRDQE